VISVGSLNMLTNDNIISFLKIWTSRGKTLEVIDLSWDDGVPKLSLNCSDIFDWALSEVEPVESRADILRVTSCIFEVEDAFPDYDGWDVAALYAARKRNRKPMPSYVNGGTPEFAKLFEGLRENDAA
jgi:hypothetical protein